MASVVEPTKVSANESEAETTLSSLDELLADAEKGNTFAKAKLQRLIQQNPAVMAALGDLSNQLRTKLLQTVGGEEEVRKVAIETNLKQLLDGLSKNPLENTPDTIKQLLLDRLALCWLGVHAVEIQFHQTRNRRLVQNFWGRELKLAQRRYLTALEAIISAGQKYSKSIG